MNEEVKQDDHEFNVDSIQLTNKIIDAFQEGNWLVATTEHGIRFRQHIPQGKRLNKKGDRYVLEDQVIG